MMLPILMGERDAAPIRLLAIGAHPDDIEIGCAGTILRLIERGAVSEVCWVVLSGSPERAAEARASADALLAGVPRRRVIVRDFADGFFPYDGGGIKRFFEDLKADFAPDVVFTHQRRDLHQDHRIACELTWNTFRDHLILEYEVPKYDGDMGAPNLFVPLEDSLRDRKVAHLMSYFASQLPKRWFQEDLFLGLLRLRGMECSSPTSYAEAFYFHKAVLA
jgi:LmbE family N-acetylglucosaminyl deacetylase